jgi:3-oxoadipate enol-lactonase
MRQVRVDGGGVDLFALEGGDGPALVFLHGGLADHRAVLPLVEPLADRYRVVAPDLRGSGRSWFSDALTFDRLADDLILLLDHLTAPDAFVGGISSGSGPAVRFALRHPERTRGLIVLRPVYGGTDLGYTASQIAAFGAMDSVASQAAVEGIEALRPLFFESMPAGMRERAWQIASGFDPGSVAATSRFIASGAQPFESGGELSSMRVPTLLVRGDDDMHPAEISDIYAACIADCVVLPATTTDIELAIRGFCDEIAAA